MDRKYSISDLASEFNVTTRTIRFYEEKGLLSPQRIGATRKYAGNERVKLKLILRGKRLGFSLDESRDIINLYDPIAGNTKQLQLLLDGINSKQKELLDKRKEINSMLSDLKQAEENCQQALNAQKIK
ncbi:MAG: MerR family transcriptional regulator [SAR86 cluster bacterium]|uniref:MerR family transcriptional regulator n=1 Tax=SAR86 cluster bacterium TaxID=2030880 RepID=A0A2A5AXI1_9GAMM|nr:MAG: MerR family transcriptional regulator [SAR86 cluster bacterium]